MIINESQLNIDDRPSHDRRIVSGYNKYLDNHINNVYKVWQTFFKPLYRGKFVEEVDNQIRNHDKSKWLEEEYLPYAIHFYPDETHKPTKEDNNAYDRAWLHHQKFNPHHWQHWVILRDNGKLVPVEMPLNYIIEMLCDWSSFQYIRNGSSAHKWYENNGSSMILHPETRKRIEYFLDVIPEL